MRIKDRREDEKLDKTEDVKGIKDGVVKLREFKRLLS
jgi:hypothetical protein